MEVLVLMVMVAIRVCVNRALPDEIAKPVS